MERRLAWSVAWILLLLAPVRAQEARPEIPVERDLVYGKGGDVELKLDLAMPKDGDGPFPAVVFIHGGGWRDGNRQQLTETIRTVAARGYVAVTISYRLVPSAVFPAQIEDCKAAIRWLRANAPKYKINPERIGAVGFSAGAHLACLLGTTDKNDGLEGNGGNADQSSRVQAVVSFFGPTDFTRKDWSDDVEQKYIAPFMGGSFKDKAEQYRKASPITYATKDDPPCLFFHGTEDKVVGIRHSRALTEKLKSVGVEARLVELEGEGHGWRGEKLFESLKQMQSFLDERLKK
jgi:acetyl esterase/lipase